MRTSVTKRTAAFEFVGIDGAVVQENGIGPRRFPMRLFFWGEDYDLAVAAFEALLLQRGTGKLEHPIYGTHDVVPFGQISRRDDLKSAANQAVLQVVFLAVGAQEYPSQTEHLPSSIDDSVASYNADAAASYAAAEPQPSRGAVSGALGDIRGALGALADATEGAQRSFAASDAAIQGAIDLLIATPLDLAQQVLTLVHAPARTGALVRARMDAYGDLLRSTIERASPRSQPSVLPEQQRLGEAAFRLGDLVGSAAVVGGVLAATDPSDPAATFRTRPRALETAESIGELATAWIAWRELRFRDHQILDDGVVQQAVQRAVPLTQRYLRELSFGLLSERTIVLDRARTILDLAAELFGDISETRLDLLVEANDLSGAEILELPRGRAIAYEA